MKYQFLTKKLVQWLNFIFIVLIVLISFSDYISAEEFRFYSNDELGFSFNYQADLFINKNSLPDHTILLTKNQTRTDMQSLLLGEGGISVTFKNKDIEINGKPKILLPEDYIYREASGIDKPMLIDKSRVGDFDLYKVKRFAAGTDIEILMFYIFKDSKVFRVGVFPYIQEDKKEGAALQIINTLRFTK